IDALVIEHPAEVVLRLRLAPGCELLHVLESLRVLALVDVAECRNLDILDLRPLGVVRLAAAADADHGHANRVVRACRSPPPGRDERRSGSRSGHAGVLQKVSTVYGFHQVLLRRENALFYRRPGRNEEFLISSQRPSRAIIRSGAPVPFSIFIGSAIT